MLYYFYYTTMDLFPVRVMISDLKLNTVSNLVIPDIQLGIRKYFRLSVAVCKSPLF